MRALFLALVLCPMIAFGAVTARAVRSFNGRSGVITIPVVQMYKISHTFTQDYTNGQTTVIGNMPAGIQVLRVGVAGEATTSQSFFSVGNGAAAPYSADINSFSSTSVGPNSEPYFYNQDAVAAPKFTVAVPLTITHEMNTVDLTGVVVEFLVEYIEL